MEHSVYEDVTLFVIYSTNISSNEKDTALFGRIQNASSVQTLTLFVSWHNRRAVSIWLWPVLTLPMYRLSPPLLWVICIFLILLSWLDLSRYWFGSSSILITTGWSLKSKKSTCSSSNTCSVHCVSNILNNLAHFTKTWKIDIVCQESISTLYICVIWNVIVS